MPHTLLHYAFGPFVLDPAERRLLRDGGVVALYPKAFDVLAVLLGRAGHLVTKDEIMEAVWPGVVVEESALSVAVSRLRTALGPDGHGAIETVPGHGYRFAAPVTVLEGAAEPYPHDEDSAADAPRVEDVIPVISGDGVGPPRPGPSPKRVAPEAPPSPVERHGRRVLFAGAVVLILVAAVAVAMRGDRPAEAPMSVLTAANEPPADALLAYRSGRALWEMRAEGDVMSRALAQFNRAATLDSTFAAAYVGKALVYAIGYRTGLETEEAAARALALDSTIAEAWAARAFARGFQAWDWSGAEIAFARARALDPADLTTLQWLAALRMVQRRLPEAEALLQQAAALRPDYAPLHTDLCEVRYYRGDRLGAEAACDRAQALQPSSVITATRRHLLAVTEPDGRAEAVRLLTSESRSDFDAYVRARLHARLGHRDSALVYVEQAVAERMFLAPFLNPEPLFDFVRNDPRWLAAVRRMGLE